MGKLTIAEAKERCESMRKAAAELHLLSSVMWSTTPEKQRTLEKIRDLTADILELIETLERDVTQEP